MIRVISSGLSTLLGRAASAVKAPFLNRASKQRSPAKKGSPTVYAVGGPARPRRLAPHGRMRLFRSYPATGAGR